MLYSDHNLRSLRRIAARRQIADAATAPRETLIARLELADRTQAAALAEAKAADEAAEAALAAAPAIPAGMIHTYDGVDVRVEYWWSRRDVTGLEVLTKCTPIDTDGTPFPANTGRTVCHTIARTWERGATPEQARNNVLRALGGVLAIREYIDGSQPSREG